MTTTSARRQNIPLLSLLLGYTVTILLLLCTVAVHATNEEGIKYLEDKAKEEGVIKLASGLQYKVITKGKGAFHPKADSSCLCHYAGTLIDGTEFDSSYSRGSPTTFAPNQVIKGWTEAMQLMVEGDKWELYIPSELAYGERGSPPKIPGESALVFTIEMIEIMGDKVPAVRCNPSTLEDCDERMVKYIEKSRVKYGDDGDLIEEEIERLTKIGSSGGMKSELKSWIDTRVIILQQMLMSINANDEL